MSSTGSPDRVVKDFEVTVKIRNNRLKERRLDLGLSCREIER